MGTNIKNKTAELLKRNFDLDPETTRALFEAGVLEEHNCRRVLVRDEYLSQCGTDVMKKDVKQALADKYNVSCATVEKYVYALTLCHD